jgi:hypothetical protein
VDFVLIVYSSVHLSTSPTPFLLSQAFTDHYYQAFDQNRGALSSLYSDQSVLCFEGHKSHGSQAIISKLTTLPFQRCQHKITSLDSHAVPSAGVLVFVTGQLLVRTTA